MRRGALRAYILAQARMLRPGYKFIVYRPVAQGGGLVDAAEWREHVRAALKGWALYVELTDEQTAIAGGVVLKVLRCPPSF